MQLIELADANDFISQVTLDGVILRLHFSWSGDDWTLGVRDADDNEIVRGIPIRVNHPLLMPYRRHLAMLKGEFFAICNDGGCDLSRDDFTSGRAKFIYMSREEVEAVHNGTAI